MMAVATGLHRMTMNETGSSLIALDGEIRSMAEQRLIKAMVDSGAEGCFLSNHIAQDLGLEITPSPYQYLSINGEKLPVSGRVRATYSITDSSGTTRAGVSNFDIG
jgi:hypothetical protein